MSFIVAHSTWAEIEISRSYQKPQSICTDVGHRASLADAVCLRWSKSFKWTRCCEQFVNSRNLREGFDHIKSDQFGLASTTFLKHGNTEPERVSSTNAEMAVAEARIGITGFQYLTTNIWTVRRALFRAERVLNVSQCGENYDA